MTTNGNGGTQQGEVLVLGLGNPWMGDDGAGAGVVELLQARHLPSWMRVQTADIWDLPASLEGKARVILVDAAQMGFPPGTWKRFTPQEANLFTNLDFHSLHQAGVAEALALAQALGFNTDHVVCYGIEPATLEGGQGLSPAVQAALPGLIDAILSELTEIEV